MVDVGNNFLENYCAVKECQDDVATEISASLSRVCSVTDATQL
jgi:hypothetical protein